MDTATDDDDCGCCPCCCSCGSEDYEPTPIDWEKLSPVQRALIARTQDRLASETYESNPYLDLVLRSATTPAP